MPATTLLHVRASYVVLITARTRTRTPAAARSFLCFPPGEWAGRGRRKKKRGGRGFPTPVFSRQLGLFLLGYRGVFSIFWKRFNMFFLITKPGGNEGKQAKTQTNPAEMPEDRRRWGPGWLGTSTEGPRGSLQTSFKSRNQPDEGLCVSGTPPAAKKPTGWPFPAWNPAF